MQWALPAQLAANLSHPRCYHYHFDNCNSLYSWDEVCRRTLLFRRTAVGVVSGDWTCSSGSGSARRAAPAAAGRPSSAGPQWRIRGLRWARRRLLRGTTADSGRARRCSSPAGRRDLLRPWTDSAADSFGWRWRPTSSDDVDCRTSQTPTISLSLSLSFIFFRPFSRWTWVIPYQNVSHSGCCNCKTYRVLTVCLRAGNWSWKTRQNKLCGSRCNMPPPISSLCGRRSASLRRAGRNVAVGSHDQYVHTLTAAALTPHE